LIILDSDVLIEIFDKRSMLGETALKKILDTNKDFCTTSISLHEVLYGMYKYANFIEGVVKLPVIDYTKDDALVAAKLEFEVEKKGNKVERTDSMIAAISINRNSELYTFNKKHFEKFEDFGLKIFNDYLSNKV